MMKLMHWRCRRGMKELELLLQHYLHHHYPQASLIEQQHFQTLLTYSDHELYAYLFEHKPVADSRLRPLIEKIQLFKE